MFNGRLRYQRALIHHFHTVQTTLLTMAVLSTRFFAAVLHLSHFGLCFWHGGMSGLVSVTAQDDEGSCSSRTIEVADHEENLMVGSRETI